VAKLPTVTSPLPRDLQQFVQRVREALDSGGPDAVVTARQLIASGVVERRSGGEFTPVGGTIDPARPPRNLSASGALASIILSWDAANYKGHAYTEIWAYTTDAIGEAVLVGMTSGNNFSHTLGAAATRYYWVRNVNQNGVVSAYNATNGTQGSTGQDPAYLLDVLTDEITTSQLATALNTRIDLIDGASTVTGSVNARIATQATTTTNALALKADAATVTSLAVTVGTNTAAITSEATARATADTSLASDITALQTTVGTNTAAITSETTARTSADTSLASDITTLQTTTGGHTTSIQTNATSINGLEGQYTVKIDNNGAVAGFGLASTTTGSGDITSEFIVNADRFAIMRGGSDTTAAVVPFAVQSTQQTINGETVPIGVYMDTAFIKNGTISNAKIGSLTADKITASLLNTVDFYGNTIAGSSIYLGGTVTYDQDSGGNNIGIQSVATPKVAMTSTGAVFAVDAFTINNPGGTDVVPFSITSDVVSIDSALIKDGTITNAKIGNQIASTAYIANNNTGWAISKDGDAILNDATFRGTLDITGSSGSNRLEITGDTIKVIDSSNVVRVKIGDLS
tara:strand:+ start:3414 stop:5141 length:1728 start_codon:yes stop_codon:yes gene_type:complete